LMDATARRSADLGHVLGGDQHGENVAQPLHQVRGKLPRVVSSMRRRSPRC
jgi:hypothetical protein